VHTEEIFGERFISVEPTPVLAGCIAAGRDALAVALGERARVHLSLEWEFDPSTRLVPSIVVSRSTEDNGGPVVPDLVVEFRTESTGRYILGPKRMVYSRFRVPEFWYVDPRGRRLAVLRSRGGGEYDWPPLVVGDGDVLELSRFPGTMVQASALLDAPGVSRVALASRDAEAWLAA
jgi:Uma2 family endonuclease